jgi:hypothetical protein
MIVSICVMIYALLLFPGRRILWYSGWCFRFFPSSPSYCFLGAVIDLHVIGADREDGRVLAANQGLAHITNQVIAQLVKHHFDCHLARLEAELWISHRSPKDFPKSCPKVKSSTGSAWSCLHLLVCLPLPSHPAIFSPLLCMVKNNVPSSSDSPLSHLFIPSSPQKAASGVSGNLAIYN